jgi:hypothetical protein
MSGTTTSKPQTGTYPDTPHQKSPRLENGDHLTREEFERRYTALPRLKKAELIEGTVHMPSPVSSRHSGPHLDLCGWLWSYRNGTPGVDGGDNATVRLDADNEPQPDALLFIKPEFGGQIRIDEDHIFRGAPELIGEIAVSSVSIDLHSKKNVYRRGGVREYIVWRIDDEAVDWFVLREGRYEALAPDAGILKSTVFSGLWLDPAALLSGQTQTVLNVLQQGLASPEHAAFVSRLQRK